MKQTRSGVWKLILGLLALAASAALMIFVIVPFLKEGRSPAPTEAAGSTPAQSEAVPKTEPAPATESASGEGPVSSEPDTTPVSTEPVSTEPVSTEAASTAPAATEPIATEAAPTDPPVDPPVPVPTPTDVAEGPGDVHIKAHQAGTVFVTEGCGYSAYYFGETNSGRYCEAVNRVARAVEGKAQVYCLIAPLSTGVMLSDEVRSDLGFSDQNKAIAWMYDHMDPLVKPVPVYGALKLHNDENIYFHTDHHWTALGTWYAYREFCAAKGIPVHERSEFEYHSYPDYQGSFLGYSNGSAELKANPDTLEAWVPKGTNTMTTYIAEGSGYTKLNWPIVKDVSNYSKGSYYLGFVSGDRPWSYAHNESITDGSSVLVVKDSYGNAFIPWLIDHYEHIYWIDYREYPEWCPWAGVADDSISNFVERNSIRDVILLNQIGSTGSSTNLKDIEKIFR